MMNKIDYFLQAESWAVDNQGAAARSRRVAWTIAGAAAGLAMLEAVALAMLTPLKTVQPITLLVDRQTGYVQAIDPLRPKRVTADEALTQALLAQYVSAREGFDRATVSADYRRVALWSAGRARRNYLTEMPASNPASPFQRYPAGTVVTVRVTSVSQLNEDTALVRFDTLRQDPNSGTTAVQPWISVIRYRFIDAPMRFEDRLANPLGFQVTAYRRDAEAPAPLVSAANPEARSSYPIQSISGQGGPMHPPPANPTPSGTANVVGAINVSSEGAIDRTSVTVPLDSIPLGSPLDPNLASDGARGETR
jgi:type IV secretion system protein VirB8